MDAVIQEEQIWIQDIINGKRSGFHRLFDSLYPALYAFGRKYLQDNLMLEDFIQESFISFWNKRTDFENIGSVKAFLYTSVKNSCINYLRHEAVKRKNEDSIALSLKSDHFYSNAVIEEETFNKLYEEIKLLPESSQKVMLLALNGLKNPEIAEELGVSVNTVKTLKKNAYNKLRGKLSSSLRLVLYLFYY